MRKIIVLNSLSGVVQILIGTVLVFFTIPIFISKLGIELYGIYSILLLIGNLNSITNLGITSSLLKFVSEQGKVQQSNNDIIVSFAVLFFVGILFNVIGFVFHNFILVNLLGIPSKYYNQDTIVLFYCLLVANGILFVGQIGVAVLDSLQKIYLTNLLQLVYNFSYWSFVLLSLFIFTSLKMIGVAILLSSSIWMILIIIFFIKHWGKINFRGLNKNFKFTLKKNISYGSKIYFSGVINLFFEPLSKILISNFIGISEVGYYDIILRIKTQLMNLITKGLYPIIPHLSVEQNINKIRLLIHDLEQKISFLIIPLLVMTIYGIPAFIELWLGKNLNIISLSATLIISVYLLSIILLPNYQFLTFKGYPNKTILMQFSNIIINVLIFFSLLSTLSFYAIIAGNIGALIVSTGQGLYYQKKYLNSLIFENIRQFINWIRILILLLLSGFLIYMFAEENLLKISLTLIIIPSIFIFLLREFRIFNPQDISRYTGKNEFIFNIVTKLVVR